MTGSTSVAVVAPPPRHADRDETRTEKKFALIFISPVGHAEGGWRSVQTGPPPHVFKSVTTQQHFFILFVCNLFFAIGS